MSNPVFTKSYAVPALRRREILRYALCRESDTATEQLLDRCLPQMQEKLRCRVCWRELTADEIAHFSARSALLEKNLQGSAAVILFAATVGAEADRLIARCSRLSPAKGLMMQAIGAESIEALCDTFCRDIAEQYGLAARPRFSPGYGDLPLDAQREIFSLLSCEKRIGLCLNDSLLMSPSKSVTAFLALAEEAAPSVGKPCAACSKLDCAFRG